MATRQHALCFVWVCHGFYSIKLKKFTADFIYLIWLIYDLTENAIIEK